LIRFIEKGKNMPSDIEQAEHVLNNLRQKRVAAGVRGHGLGEESTKLAFAAHTGDKAARQKLDKVNAEVALFESELRSLDSAIAEGTARVEAARQAEAQAADRQRAAEARKLVKELGEVFPYLDRKLEEAGNALIAINDGIAKLHELGIKHPDDRQLRLGVATILQSWAHRLPRSWHDHLRDGFEFLAPGRRQTAVGYWKAIEPSLQNTIRQATGEAEQPNKERAA
jgi:hypothetical protein